MHLTIFSKDFFLPLQPQNFLEKFPRKKRPNLLVFFSGPVIFRSLYHIFLASVGTFSGSFLFYFLFYFSVPYFGLACDHGNSFLCLEK